MRVAGPVRIRHTWLLGPTHVVRQRVCVRCPRGCWSTECGHAPGGSGHCSVRFRYSRLSELVDRSCVPASLKMALRRGGRVRGPSRARGCTREQSRLFEQQPPCAGRHSLRGEQSRSQTRPARLRAHPATRCLPVQDRPPCRSPPRNWKCRHLLGQEIRPLACLCVAIRSGPSPRRVPKYRYALAQLPLWIVPLSFRIADSECHINALSVVWGDSHGPRKGLLLGWSNGCGRWQHRRKMRLE